MAEIKIPISIDLDEMIEYMAENDFVEIIRCKECAIRYDSCPMVVRIGGNVDFFTDDNDFCSRGRRKE